MNKLKLAVLMAVTLCSASSMAQQNVYKFDVKSDTKLNIPANSKGLAAASKEDDVQPEAVIKIENIGGVNVRTVDGEASPLPTCLAYIQAGLGQGVDGVYASTHVSGVNLRCDMTTDGGGWTLVAAQYEDAPAGWTGGGQYDPTLANQRGWTLGTLPAHSQTGFGHAGISGVYPEFYMSFTYTTGNIPKTLITDQHGYSHHIHRNSGAYYARHDPEFDYRVSSDNWNNTLTVDYQGEDGVESLWTFGPYRDIRNQRGFGYKTYLAGSWQAEPWLIFVR